MSCTLGFIKTTFALAGMYIVNESTPRFVIDVPSSGVWIQLRNAMVAVWVEVAEAAAFFALLFAIQPVLHDWCNKGRGMCYPVCGMVHIKEPFLLIGKSSLCGGGRFPFSLSEWSFTICLMPYDRK